MSEQEDRNAEKAPMSGPEAGKLDKRKMYCTKEGTDVWGWFFDSARHGWVHVTTSPHSIMGTLVPKGFWEGDLDFDPVRFVETIATDPD